MIVYQWVGWEIWHSKYGQLLELLVFNIALFPYRLKSRHPKDLIDDHFRFEPILNRPIDQAKMLTNMKRKLSEWTSDEIMTMCVNSYVQFMTQLKQSVIDGDGPVYTHVAENMYNICQCVLGIFIALDERFPSLTIRQECNMLMTLNTTMKVAKFLQLVYKNLHEIMKRDDCYDQFFGDSHFNHVVFRSPMMVTEVPNKLVLCRTGITAVVKSFGLFKRLALHAPTGRQMCFFGHDPYLLYQGELVLFYKTQALICADCSKEHKSQQSHEAYGFLRYAHDNYFLRWEVLLKQNINEILMKPLSCCQMFDCCFNEPLMALYDDARPLMSIMIMRDRLISVIINKSEDMYSSSVGFWSSMGEKNNFSSSAIYCLTEAIKRIENLDIDVSVSSDNMQYQSVIDDVCVHLWACNVYCSAGGFGSISSDMRATVKTTEQLHYSWFKLNLPKHNNAECSDIMKLLLQLVKRCIKIQLMEINTRGNKAFTDNIAGCMRWLLKLVEDVPLNWIDKKNEVMNNLLELDDCLFWIEKGVEVALVGTACAIDKTRFGTHIQIPEAMRVEQLAKLQWIVEYSTTVVYKRLFEWYTTFVVKGAALHEEIIGSKPVVEGEKKDRGTAYSAITEVVKTFNAERRKVWMAFVEEERQFLVNFNASGNNINDNSVLSLFNDKAI